MQWENTVHIRRAGDKYPLCIIGKCPHAEQQALLGHGEQCNGPGAQGSKGWEQGAAAGILGPEEPGSGRWV